jgi:hypothetical protein
VFKNFLTASLVLAALTGCSTFGSGSRNPSSDPSAAGQKISDRELLMRLCQIASSSPPGNYASSAYKKCADDYFNAFSSDPHPRDLNTAILFICENEAYGDSDLDKVFYRYSCFQNAVVLLNDDSILKSTRLCFVNPRRQEMLGIFNQIEERRQMGTCFHNFFLEASSRPRPISPDKPSTGD